MPVTGWVADQVTAFRNLAGYTVTGWVGTEMAFREVGPSGRPEFQDSSIPFLQVCPLYLEIGGGLRQICTYQNDDNWGLCIADHQSGPPDESQEEGSIYRTRHLAELPIGRVGGVRSALSESGDLIEVTLTLGRREVVLQAGEVYEGWDGGLSVIRPDESILVSVEPTSEPEPGA